MNERSNWERFLRWRRIWQINNDFFEEVGGSLKLPKKSALKEMTKYLVESDREGK